MVCVKQLNVIGGVVSNLTIGKQYNVSPIPLPLYKGDVIKKPDNPKVWVWVMISILNINIQWKLLLR